MCPEACSLNIHLFLRHFHCFKSKCFAQARFLESSQHYFCWSRCVRAQIDPILDLNSAPPIPRHSLNYFLPTWTKKVLVIFIIDWLAFIWCLACKIKSHVAYCIKLYIFVDLLLRDSRTIRRAFAILWLTTLSSRRRSRFPRRFAILTRRVRFRSMSSTILFREGSGASSDTGPELGTVSRAT